MKNARLIAYGDFIVRVNPQAIESIDATINVHRRDGDGSAMQVWIVTLISGAKYEIDQSDHSNPTFIRLCHSYRDIYLR
jgi:hypothetical protein